MFCEQYGKKRYIGRERKSVCVCGRVDDCLSVCILHLAHDWYWIHLEGRVVLTLTDNSFHIVRNPKQTVHVGNCCYNSAMLWRDGGSRKQTEFHRRSHKHHRLRPLIPSALNTTPHNLLILYHYSIILRTIVQHTTYINRCINKLHKFSALSVYFTLPTLNETGFIVFTGSLPFQCSFPKQMFFGLKDKAYASPHNFTSAKQAWCSQAEGAAREKSNR